MEHVVCRCVAVNGLAVALWTRTSSLCNSSYCIIKWLAHDTLSIVLDRYMPTL